MEGFAWQWLSTTLATKFIGIRVPGRGGARPSRGNRLIGARDGGWRWELLIVLVLSEAVLVLERRERERGSEDEDEDEDEGSR